MTELYKEEKLMRLGSRLFPPKVLKWPGSHESEPTYVRLLRILVKECGI